MARKTKPAHKGTPVNFYVDDEQLERWKAQAESMNLSLSAFIRLRVDGLLKTEAA